MRLFIGIELPERERERLVGLKEVVRVKGKVKWVEKENLHITLLFIGEAEPDEIIKLLDGIESGLRRFTVKLSGISAFPGLSRPRVLWVGVEQGRREIEELHSAIYERLKDIVKPEKSFIPHVTFGRVKYGKVELKKLEIEDTESFVVDSFILFKSNLTPEGPVYSVVKRYNFGGEHW